MAFEVHLVFHLGGEHVIRAHAPGVVPANALIERLLPAEKFAKLVGLFHLRERSKFSRKVQGAKTLRRVDVPIRCDV